MATKSSKTAPRNPIVVAMMARYGRTTTTMKDRRASRGGARNKQRDYRDGNY
jgi:hypothetical protein